MKRLLAITIGGLCLLTLGLGVSQAGPGDPIGGDDPGCAPATKDDLKCSDGSLKNFAKAWAAATKCHIKQADAAFKNGVPGDDEDKVSAHRVTGRRARTGPRARFAA